MPKNNVKRLFAQFQPTHYQITLEPDVQTMTFQGTVKITGKKVGRPSQRLVFHQNGLKITDCRVARKDKSTDMVMTVDRVNLHARYDEVRLHTKEMLYPGMYDVTLAFSGIISRNMEGIYPSTFTHDGHKKQLIATQFESHHARDAFPCIDEPEAKATFELALETPQGVTAISNAPVRAQINDGDRMRTIFEVTPKMSTYLLAFVVGEIGYREAQTKDGTTIRIYATPDNVQHTGFALETAVKTLEFYNEYFDIPYPLEKCDMIALPDFASGAMENWGLITYREAGLLYEEGNTSTDTKQYIASVIAHELTHQWFGNLVTMKWWTDLWLNEGFASWMSILAVDTLFPQWNVWTQFISDEQSIALRADALEHTHPIEVPVHHPDEIRVIFDAISYDKGASVIHMLHKHLGADAFRDGIRAYLKKHAYGNTVTTDLWDALEAATGKHVRGFMHDWVTYTGYPVVRATVTDTHVTLEQSRLILNPQAKKSTTTWPVPLVANQPLGIDTLDKARATIPVNGGTAALIVNAGRSGFYRTTYDPAHLHKLGAEVLAGNMSALDRYALLDDAFETAKAGHGSTVSVLELLPYYRHEDNPIVWDAIANTIGGTRAVMNNEELRDAMKPYIRTLVRNQRTRLGWQPTPGEPHFDAMLRPTVISMAASADEPEVLAEIARQFNTMQSSADILPDLRGIVYTISAYHGDAATFDRLLHMHNTTASSEERVKLCAALTGFKQPELIDQALSLMATETVRLQDLFYWIVYIFSNRYAKRQAWQWMQDNWDYLEQNIGQDLSFYRMPIYVARSWSDASFLPEFKTFFHAHMKPAFKRNVEQGIETITWQSAWRERDFNSVAAFFDKHERR